MSRIRHTNTKLELLVRKYLFLQGYRFRVKNKLFGKPDIVFHSRKIAIFVNGCFWHKHKGCKLSYVPKTNAVFWSNKLSSNAERDIKVNKKLSSLGWKIIRVWECDLESDFNKTAHSIIKSMQQ